MQSIDINRNASKTHKPPSAGCTGAFSLGSPHFCSEILCVGQYVTLDLSKACIADLLLSVFIPHVASRNRIYSPPMALLVHFLDRGNFTTFFVAASFLSLQVRLPSMLFKARCYQITRHSLTSFVTISRHISSFIHSHK